MSKVLVLGAGASRAYGYPLGWELRQKILTLQTNQAIEAGIVTEWMTRQLAVFQTAFRESQMYSIDAFLARRTEFSEIGKKCIAHILLSCERRELLFREDERDHWYQYLLNSYVQVDWDELDFSDLSVITFNYDRSLEHFFLYALQSAYGKTQDEVLEKLRNLRIIHVYGALGSTYPENTGRYRAYDHSVIDPYWVDVAANSIHVIPEGRAANAAELEAAHDLLEQASGICFLGFGFDKLNVERLAVNEACSMRKLREGGHTHRRIAGTCFGMTQQESDLAWYTLTSDSKFGRVPNEFKQLNCTQLLRDTLFLN